MNCAMNCQMCQIFVDFLFVIGIFKSHPNNFKNAYSLTLYLIWTTDFTSNDLDYIYYKIMLTIQSDQTVHIVTASTQLQQRIFFQIFLQNKWNKYWLLQIKLLD
jgi:hypothetical protein